MFPELKAESKEIQDKRYDHYNQKREEAIEKAIERREEIINLEEVSPEKSKEKNFFNSTKYSSNNTNNSNNQKFYLTQNKFYNGDRSQSVDKFNNSKNMNNVDSTLIKKEMEKLNLIKKQQVGEIRNLIDYEYFLNELRKKNRQKEILKEMKEERIRKERIKQQKLKEERMKQKEEERMEKKRKEEEELERKYKEQEEKKLENEKKEKLKKLKMEEELNKRKEESKIAAEELKQRMEKNLEEEMSIRIKKQEIMEAKESKRIKMLEMKRIKET